MIYKKVLIVKKNWEIEGARQKLTVVKGEASPEVDQVRRQPGSIEIGIHPVAAHPPKAHLEMDDAAPEHQPSKDIEQRGCENGHGSDVRPA